MEPNVRSVHPKQALAVYADSLVEASRVVVFGNGTHGLGSRFAELGARSVEVWDPDAIRASGEAERAPPGVTVHAYDSAHATPNRPFDLAIVPDLGLFDDAADLIARIREMVGEDGVALVAAPNRDTAGPPRMRGFDYYELFDLVAAEFGEVRMVAEVPFHGIALVRLGDEEEPHAVSVDTQLAEAHPAADGFVVVASQRPLAFEPYTIIELSEASGVVRLPRDVEIARADLLEAREQLETLQIEAQRKVDALLVELRARTAAGELAALRSVELEGMLQEQSIRASELEGALLERARHLSELSTEVEEMRAVAEAGHIAAAEIEPIARRAERAERRNSELERELATVGDVYARELVQFEEGLRERARLVQSLEAELARRDKMVRELASALEEATAAPAPSSEAPAQAAMNAPQAEGARGLSEENARLRDQLNVLALEIARREGEAQAVAWTVAELERKLAQAVTAAQPEAEALRAALDELDALRRATAQPEAEALRAALDELDALRRATAQEHEDRKKAESAEALARAEVERQAALLAEMAGQLDSRRREAAGPG